MDREERNQKLLKEMEAKTDELTKQIEHAVFLRHNKLFEKGCCDETHLWLDWVYERTGGSTWLYGEYNGKIRLYIDNYKKKKSMFRVKKDGTMDIDAIADEINSRIKINHNIKKRKEGTAKRTNNEKIVKQILADHNISEWDSHLKVNYSHGYMSFNISNLNEEQARAFVTLGVALNIIKQKKAAA